LIRRLGALALLAALPGCDSATEPITTFWEGTLVPVLPATVGGRVSALTRAGRTQATILIEDAEPGVPHAWRIEKGTCEAPGALQGGIGSYPELLPDQAGTASADTSIPDLFRSGESFAARVIRSPEGGPTETVACAQLAETGG
jgi:hypothetical protein